jgi:hypothetical protein
VAGGALGLSACDRRQGTVELACGSWRDEICGDGSSRTAEVHDCARGHQKHLEMEWKRQEEADEVMDAMKRMIPTPKPKPSDAFFRQVRAMLSRRCGRLSTNISSPLDMAMQYNAIMIKYATTGRTVCGP